MSLQVEDLDDQSKYRQILAIPYDELLVFVFDNIRKKSGLMVFFWSVCFVLLGIALTVRINIAPYFPLKHIILHTFLGLIIFPVLYIPVHEFLHIVPYWLSGAKDKGRYDLKQYVLCNSTQICYFTGTVPDCSLIPFLLTTIAFIFRFCSPRVFGNGAGSVPCCSYHNVCRRFCNAEFLLSQQEEENIYRMISTLK